jgi:hypothetical protein
MRGGMYSGRILLLPTAGLRLGNAWSLVDGQQEFRWKRRKERWCAQEVDIPTVVAPHATRRDELPTLDPTS